MSQIYNYQNRNVKSFLNILYNEGVEKSQYLTDSDVEEILTIHLFII